MFKKTINLNGYCSDIIGLAGKLGGNCIGQEPTARGLKQTFEFALESRAQMFVASASYFSEFISEQEEGKICPIGYAIAESRLCPCGRVTKWECRSACEIAERVA